MGRVLGGDLSGRERATASSVRTARNRRTRTRMSGGVGAGRGNPPGDPIRHRLVLPPAPPRLLPFEEADKEQTNSKHYGVHDEKADMCWFQES